MSPDTRIVLFLTSECGTSVWEHLHQTTKRFLAQHFTQNTTTWRQSHKD